MPAGSNVLPPEARLALEEYLAALDAALPDLARGVYLTGSAVLGGGPGPGGRPRVFTRGGRGLSS
jgi:hypothetical protein